MKKYFLYIWIIVTSNQLVIQSMDDEKPVQKNMLPRKPTTKRPDTFKRKPQTASKFKETLESASAAQVGNEKEKKEISPKRGDTPPRRSQKIKYIEQIRHSAIAEEFSDVQANTAKLEHEMRKDYLQAERMLQEIKELLAQQEALDEITQQQNQQAKE